MKFSRLLLCVFPLLLTACGLSDQQKADYSAVERSGVSSATYDKMVHDDPLSISDIKALSRARVNEGIILRYLRDHQTVYYLSNSDIEGLKSAGVSGSIIDYLLQTGREYGPGPYPYPVVGIGIDPFWYGPGYYGPYYHHHWR